MYVLSIRPKGDETKNKKNNNNKNGTLQILQL